MKSYTTIDKSTWGDGPWTEEPDKIFWIDQVTGLDCLIVRSVFSGSLCGYVGVPPEHPAYDKDYDSIEVDVYGGLTYGDFCQEEAPEESGVCHLPEDGATEKPYWLGFDTAHFRDLLPAMIAREREMGLETAHTGKFGETYKTVEYVKAEVEQLALQLA